MFLRNPGPDTYGERDSLRYKTAPSYGMSVGKRPDAIDPELKKVPGPGSYKIQTQVGDAPKY